MACAILFLAYTFVYLYLYEADMLVVEQNAASGGQTHYEPLIGAVLLTLTLYGVQLLAATVTRLRGVFHAITYFPSILILTLLTDSPSEAPAVGLSFSWLLPFVVLMAVWGFVAILARRYQKLELPVRHAGLLLTQLTTINVLTLTTLLLIPSLFGNHDKLFHQRVHQEYLIAHGRYAEALTLGRQLPQDSHQTMVNAYCLLKDSVLPDSLFTELLPAGMKSLLPSSQNGHFLLLADSTVYKTAGRHRDLLLCQRLMRRQLPQFAKRLNEWYQRRTLLPTHYREAISLCRQQHPELVSEFPTEPMDTTLLDFQRLRKEGKADSLRLRYAKTYWYYHYLGK